MSTAWFIFISNVYHLSSIPIHPAEAAKLIRWSVCLVTCYEEAAHAILDTSPTTPCRNIINFFLKRRYHLFLTETFFIIGVYEKSLFLYFKWCRKICDIYNYFLGEWQQIVIRRCEVETFLIYYYRFVSKTIKKLFKEILNIYPKGKNLKISPHHSDLLTNILF